MIRIKRTRRHAAMSHCAVNHENIFLAKLKDSESTTCACSCLSDSLSHQVLIFDRCVDNEKHCSAGDSFNLDFHGCRRRACFLLSPRRVVHRSVARAVSDLRQLFLKLDDVFFELLVYSE
jgi:hypothetical protein